MKTMWITITLFSAFVCAYGAQVELLQNPGFEDGVLTPWTNYGNWAISTTDPHSGTYCVSNDGSNFIGQSFNPTDVNDIVSTSIWLRQPESVMCGVYLFYGASDYDTVLFYMSGTDWEEFDLLGDLRSTGNLEKLRVFGYQQTAPDITFLDDASIIYDESTGIESASLGSIKAVYK